MFRILPRVAPAARSLYTVPCRTITKFDPERHFPKRHRREVDLVLWEMDVALLENPERRWPIMGAAINRISEIAKQEAKRLQEKNG